MWYIAVIILAEPETDARRRYMCESCNVLLEAASAALAYEKAVAWGQDAALAHMYGLKFLGIEVLNQIGDQIGDGVDISGRFFEKMDVWKRIDKIVPPQEELSAIRLEDGMHKTLGDLIDPYQLRLLVRGMGAPVEDESRGE